jgi:electron transfer flavoprotein alpha subunit
VAVNTDKDAAVFAECDYGIVGDLYAVAPALAAALRGA